MQYVYFKRILKPTTRIIPDTSVRGGVFQENIETSRGHASPTPLDLPVYFKRILKLVKCVRLPEYGSEVYFKRILKHTILPATSPQ